MMDKKFESLFREFRHFKGQPVEIFTDDGRKHCGIDLEVLEDAVRIIDDCGRIQLIEFLHIDSVVEPMMRLKRCCKHECDCDDDRDDRCDDDRRRDGDRRRFEDHEDGYDEDHHKY